MTVKSTDSSELPPLVLYILNLLLCACFRHQFVIAFPTLRYDDAPFDDVHVSPLPVLIAFFYPSVQVSV